MEFVQRILSKLQVVKINFACGSLRESGSELTFYLGTWIVSKGVTIPDRYLQLIIVEIRYIASQHTVKNRSNKSLEHDSGFMSGKWEKERKSKRKPDAALCELFRVSNSARSKNVVPRLKHYACSNRWQWYSTLIIVVVEQRHEYVFFSARGTDAVLLSTRRNPPLTLSGMVPSGSLDTVDTLILSLKGAKLATHVLYGNTKTFNRLDFTISFSNAWLVLISWAWGELDAIYRKGVGDRLSALQEELV
jgi:hypothetical protein